MKVGYSIISLQTPSQKREFARFLKDTLVLEEGYADNIAEVLSEGDRVNIYTQRKLDGALRGDSFYAFVATFEVIDVPRGQYLVASAVDFRLEVQFQGSVKALVPTEYFITTESLARTLSKEVEQGLLKVYPSFPTEEGLGWILSNGDWDDEGVWMDEENWKDHE